LSSGDTQGGLAAVAEILAITRNLLQTDRDNIERRRGLSVTWGNFSSSTLGIGAALRKFFALSLPNLIVATRAWVRGLERSLATLRKHSLPKLMATRRLSQRYLRPGSVLMGKSAQFKAWIRGLQCSVELKGPTLKWPLLAPSSSHEAFSPPKQNESNEPDSRCAPFQHEESTREQCAILVLLRKENNENNVRTATASSTGPIDEPRDATRVEASMVTGGSADESPVNTRSGKRRRRKRKRHGASHCLLASQKSDIDRARMN
jgi:hypothetical protein